MLFRMNNNLKHLRLFRNLCSRPHSIRALDIAYADKVNLTYRFICDKIRSGGPMTIHEFMQICGAGTSGYYSQKKAIFGRKGDFITSPELTQMFGEAIAVWLTSELQCTGHSDYWQLVEFGAGTGTLMHDIVRALSAFKVNNFSIHIIETSEELIKKQRLKLRIWNKNKRQHSKNTKIDGMDEYAFNGSPIFWHCSIDELPQKFSVFIANEFLDALPIHQFQRVSLNNDSENVLLKNDWREVYVNLNAENNLCLMLSNSENIHTKGLIPDDIRSDPSRNLWEVCPYAADIVGRIVQRFTSNGGFALFVDYGHNGNRLTSSLRAYHKHELVNFLQKDAAGFVDLTADVDFGHLRRILEGSCLMFGPVIQRNFLLELGILHRLQALIAKCKTEEERNFLHQSFKLMMSDSVSSEPPSTVPSGMGTAFKAFALFPNTLAHIMKERGGAPIGFQSQLTKDVF